ncbi:MAG: nitronate monooxygenase [Bacillota bacterium]|nr:nitronate monooxygenase [Bacillota bacterium]
MKLPVLKIGSYTPAVPIVQGGMAVRVSTASLAGTVARHGGIGVIGATGMGLQELREEIQQARVIAGNGVIGVNIMFASGQFAELVNVSLEEKIDIIFTGAGFSRDIFRWAQGTDTVIVPIISSARAARLAERSGAPAVVAEGAEAGGHLGTDSSIYDILPEIKAEVNIPVIAAGGISNGTDMAELFRLGANGVQLATRFVLSEECAVSPAFKQTYLHASEEDIVLIKSPVGLPGRAIRNHFTELLTSGEAPKPASCVKCLRECSGAFCIMDALINAQKGNIDQGLVFSGQNVSKIKDILPVSVILEQLVQECQNAMIS